MKLLLLTLLVATVCAVTGNVIGLDFGSGTMKVALVQPGKALEIVTNFQSKRKTPTQITFYRGERMFGSDAEALMARKPDLTFARLVRMLGRSPDHSAVREMKEHYFPYKIYANETMGGNLCLKQGDTFYTPEELVAMMMEHAKAMTKNFGDKAVKDCVITVPSSFTQHERRALYSAADIADLRVLSLIEENTAAALHYGIDRVFDKPHTIVYFNMGSSRTQVTIVRYDSYSVKEAGKNKTIGQFEVVGKAWDEHLGGFHFEKVLTDLLADRFNDAWAKKKTYNGEKLQDFYAPMTRLRLQASKVKEVLSANPEFPVKAEQLHAGVDLNTKVSRVEFEAACEGLFSRITESLDAAMKMAGITQTDIDAVELLGGGVRMPRVKKTLDDYFSGSTREGGKKIDIGQHLNGDEAMALGAAFRAANLSTAFRVRKVGMNDIQTFGISVQLETLEEVEGSVSGGFFGFGSKKSADKETEGEAWVKKTGLWGAKTILPAKSKTVAITHDKDILCSVKYDDASLPNLPDSTSPLLAVYNVTGISAFAEEHKGKGLGTPKVHLSFALDASGITQLVKAVAELELPKEVEVEEEEVEVEVEAATEEGEKKEGEEEEKGEKKEEEKEGEELSEEERETKEAEEKKKRKSTLEKESAAKKAEKAKAKKEKEKREKKETHIRKVLTVQENLFAPSPSITSASMLQESRAKLAGLDAADDARRAREAALNDLEGYIYRVKNKIADEEEELAAVSTEEQRQAVLSTGEEFEEWLYEKEAKDADAAVFKGRHKQLSTLAEPIFERLAESKARPEAVATARKSLQKVRGLVANMTTSKPWVSEEAKDSMLEAVTLAETWIDEKEGLQAELEGHAEAAFHSTDVPTQLKDAAAKYEKLVKTPKPTPPKAIPSNSTSNSTANSTADGTTDSNANSTSNSTDNDTVTIDTNSTEGVGEEGVEAEGGETGTDTGTVKIDKEVEEVKGEEEL